MFLSILRKVNRAYPFLVLAGYMVAFAAAFICIFTFPLGALVLVIASVLSLAFVVFLGEVLGGIEGMLTRRCLGRNRCPVCRMGPVEKNPTRYRCYGCGALMQLDGKPLAGDTMDGVAAPEDRNLISVD